MDDLQWVKDASNLGLYKIHQSVELIGIFTIVYSSIHLKHRF